MAFRLMLVILLLIPALGRAAAMSWVVQGVEYSYEPEARAVRVSLGEASFIALAGLGPQFQMPEALTSGAVTLREARPQDQALVCEYESQPGEEAISWRVTIEPGEDCLRLTFDAAASPLIGQVWAGNCLVDGPWQRYDLTRYAEAHGQVWWDKTAWLPEVSAWLDARWVLEESNCTGFDAPNKAARGEGSFEPARRPTYSARLDGATNAIHEVLELRVSERLWDVVPRLTNPPSEYREELGQQVFLDLWGGTADQLTWLLERVKRCSLGLTPCLSVVEDWEAGGFDALLPDSLWLPEFPPNPALGTLGEYQRLCDVGKTLGRFAFRTNYMFCRDASPSVKRGVTWRGKGADGTPQWYTSNLTWQALGERQEAEIQSTWHPNAAFSDQLTSGAMPSGYHDYSTSASGEPSLRATMDRQKALCRLMKETQGGPLGSETLIDEHLLGYWVDYGDFGLMDGHNRLTSPEYKLRRLHQLSSFHGMGLMYRFFGPPPWSEWANYREEALRDDYRLVELLYGNGGYIFYYPDFPWDYLLTELLLVGDLQRHYALQQVDEVLYWSAGQWKDYEQLAREGFVPNTESWNPQPEEFGRIWVRYANGYNFVCNRLEGVFPVATPQGEIILPRYGWVAWREEAGLLAYSAFWPGAEHRVDYLEDASRKLRYLDPRGLALEGSDRIQCWLEGELAMEADVTAGKAWVRGEELSLAYEQPPGLKEIDFDFTQDQQGWKLVRGFATPSFASNGMSLGVVAEDPQLYSPPLEVEGRAGDILEIELASPDGELVQLYFTTRTAPGVSEERVFHINPAADGQLHTYRLEVGARPQWAGQTIAGLRLDPRQSLGEVRLRALRLLRGG